MSILLPLEDLLGDLRGPGNLRPRYVLESLAAQSFEDFEVLILLNGKDSEAMDWAVGDLNDPRFRTYQPGRVCRPEVSVAQLVQQSRAPFLCFASPADRWHPDLLQRLHEQMSADPRIVSAWSDEQLFNDSSTITTKSSVACDPNQSQLSELQWLLHGRNGLPRFHGLHRRTALERLKIPEFLVRWRLDTPLLLSLAQILSGELSVYLPDPLRFREDLPLACGVYLERIGGARSPHGSAEVLQRWLEILERAERVRSVVVQLLNASPHLRGAEGLLVRLAIEEGVLLHAIRTLRTLRMARIHPDDDRNLSRIGELLAILESGGQPGEIAAQPVTNLDSRYLLMRSQLALDGSRSVAAAARAAVRQAPELAPFAQRLSRQPGTCGIST